MSGYSRLSMPTKPQDLSSCLHITPLGTHNEHTWKRNAAPSTALVIDHLNHTFIPSRCNATKKAYCPKRFYRRRHKIENYFCRIKDWRRIATRYDKLARNFLAATALVGALYWIKL